MSAGIRVFKVTGRDQRWQHSSRCPNIFYALRLKQNALFAWLRENGILIASGGRKNVPFQQYINAGYFTVKEVVLDDEDGYQIRLTPQLTGKGQQWLTRKLLDAGLLKPVAAE